MIERSRIRGIVPPLVTPLNSDRETVNTVATGQLVERCVAQGVHGIFVGGTTGEVWVLDDVQWQRLVAAAVEACHGRVPVFAGVSHAATAGAVARTRLAERLGADVVVSLPPYYIVSSQADVVRHYQTIAAATSLPVVVYQYPGIAKVSITLATYQQLATIPSVLAIKDSQGDVTEFRRMINTLRGHGNDLQLLLGSDTLTDAVVLMGGQGTIPSLANVAGNCLVAAYEAAVAGAWQQSAAMQAQATALTDIYRVAGEVSVPAVVAGLKCALGLLGIEAGPTAAPVQPLDNAQAAAVEQILACGGLL